MCHEGKPSTPIGEEVTLYVVVAAKKKEKGEKEEQEREKEKEEKEKEQPPLEILLTKDVMYVLLSVSFVLFFLSYELFPSSLFVNI